MSYRRWVSIRGCKDAARPMTVFRLNQSHLFPDPRMAEPTGLLAVGGDLSPKRLLSAYARGVFPWPVEGLPLTWFSPDPRMVMEVDGARVSRSLRKRLRRQEFRLTMDTVFDEVIDACSSVPRSGELGTWITDEIRDAYAALHEIGYAHSVEVWKDDELVGGLYGVSLGDVFCGESMFHRATDASKVAFVSLAEQLTRWNFSLIDCQLHTPHLESLGAYTVPRSEFLARLSEGVERPSRAGKWEIDADLWDHLRT